ncbi:hypothetical protein EP331_08070 [bacterium]|nr:MAG: hypothetical protein EP331_08070 [bacterium]
MKKENDYTKDLSEIRSMMERSSKFKLLSGWAGIFAGLYALAATYLVSTTFDFNPDSLSAVIPNEVIYSAFSLFLIAAITAFYFSKKNAEKNGEKAWSANSRRILFTMSIPLLSGGILIFSLLNLQLGGLTLPVSLIFYGLALISAGKLTYTEVSWMGLAQLILGLLSTFFIEFSLYFWATGFGLVHIIYGLILYVRHKL